MSDKIALVTGGGGFLGRHIVERLINDGWQVRVLQRSASDTITRQGAELFQASLTDLEAVTEACKGCDAVFHVAAKAGVWGAYNEYLQTNVIGTRNILKACQSSDSSYLVYTSTPSVVFTGEAFQGANESLPYGKNFLCHYAKTKAQAEAEVLAAHQPNGLQVTALRPHLIWGVGDPHLVPGILKAARAGRLPIIGDGENKVDITHVYNAADAHLLALKALQNGRAGGKAYFLSQGEPVKLWDWAQTVIEGAGLPRLSRTISLRKAYMAGFLCEKIWTLLGKKENPPMTRFVATELAKDHWFDISAARKDLGYTPENFSTEQGLSELIAHLRS